MPNRILREGIITSEPVNSLSWAEEVFYRRLISVVDDFGRYYAKPELLRSACYPLQVDKVGNQDIAKWLTKCVGAGLVRAYTVENKEYLEVANFKQQVRAKQSKFPCPSCASYLQCTCKASEHLDEDEDEDVYIPKKRKSKFIPPDKQEVIQFFVDNGYSATAGGKAFDYYHEGKWKDSEGKPVKNWKQKMRGVWFKPENKSTDPSKGAI